MSLQPLDVTNEIPDAYKLALSESRRWLVLAYSSRSTLTLRGQGMGLPELRKQLEDEDEVLFGFLRFRRRGIVLQYTNPDCSRVVKARAQVHLQTILNFFRDNDFLLETSTPKDITLDNIARLTNSTSTSTINSNKKSKRLTDIIEESPIIGDEDEFEDGQSSPSSSEPKSPEETTELATPPSSDRAQKNTILLKPIGPETALASPPLTPRSPLPPSPLRRTPSPSETASPSIKYQRDSYESSTSSENPSQSPNSPTQPTPPPPPAEKLPPLPPEKLRLLKALEIRRQKLSGIKVVVIPKMETSFRPPTETVSTTPPPIVKPPNPERKAHLIEAKRLALEEQKKHIASLEASGRDLLSGWVNFQSSTSMLWRRKFIRITCSRELILSETEDSSTMGGAAGSDKATCRWKIGVKLKGIMMPESDEEQLPHSLRLVAEKETLCSIACQTAGDLVNLRRVFGYCLNDDKVFSA